MNVNDTMTVEQIQAMPRLGGFFNSWRKRSVSIHQDPEDSTMVYTVGYPVEVGAAPVLTHEPKMHYRYQL